MNSEFQNEFVTLESGKLLSCLNCDSAVLYNHDNASLVFTCNCGEVNPDTLPEWLKGEFDYV